MHRLLVILWHGLLVAIGVVGSAILSNEFIGGIHSTSKLYPYVIRPDREPQEFPDVYEFARLQIVHDRSIGSPLRMVRFFAGGGERVVVFDRTAGDAWDTGRIDDLLSSQYPHVPVAVRAAWAESVFHRIQKAREDGPQSAEEDTVDIYDDAYLMFLYGDTAPSFSEAEYESADVLVGTPGMQIWYPKPFRFLLLWGVVFGGYLFILRRLTRAIRRRDGGDGGGDTGLATGTRDDVAKNRVSHMDRYLRAML